MCFLDITLKVNLFWSFERRWASARSFTSIWACIIYRLSYRFYGFVATTALLFGELVLSLLSIPTQGLTGPYIFFMYACMLRLNFSNRSPLFVGLQKVRLKDALYVLCKVL